MPKTTELPLDDVSSAPESGTVRDETSGNQPSDRNIDSRHQQCKVGGATIGRGEDASIASEEP